MWMLVLSGVFVLIGVLFFGLAIQEAKKPIKLPKNTEYYIDP